MQRYLYPCARELYITISFEVSLFVVCHLHRAILIESHVLSGHEEYQPAVSIDENSIESWYVVAGQQNVKTILFFSNYFFHN